MSACHSGFGRHVTSHAWLTADTAQDAATGHGNRCNGSIWRGCRGEEVCTIWYSTVRAFRQCNMGNASDAPCGFWYILVSILVSQSKLFKNGISSFSWDDSWLSAFPNSKGVKTQASMAPGFLTTLSPGLPRACEGRKPGWIGPRGLGLDTPAAKYLEAMNSCWERLFDSPGHTRMETKWVRGDKYHKWIRPISENYARLWLGKCTLILASCWSHTEKPVEADNCGRETWLCPVVPSVIKNGCFWASFCPIHSNCLPAS